MKLGRLDRAQFELVYREGAVKSGPLLAVRILAGGEPRLAVAVGKRLEKRAVMRNRARRRIREAVRSAGVALPGDVVVTARPRAMTASFAELSAEVVRLLGPRERAP